MNNRKVLIAIIVGILVSVVVFAMISQNKSKQNNDTIETIGVTSPFTDSTISPSVFYQGDLYPTYNQRAAKSNYVIFDLGDLQVQKEIKDALTYGVIPYLQQTQPKNPGDIYVHLNKDSVEYKSAELYSFTFYVDSPEGWYSYVQKPNNDGTPGTHIKPIDSEGL